MLRLLYIILIMFILSKTISEIANDSLSGFASGKSLNGYSITFQNNPIEYSIVIISRLGVICFLLILLKGKSEKE